jgi:hypothetical protein
MSLVLTSSIIQNCKPVCLIDRNNEQDTKNVNSIKASAQTAFANFKAMFVRPNFAVLA